ncbi:hypothetical protein E2320_001982 [Naja naja]|nr:hypothetical protein E2320_001982 [Naja naja]
MQNRKKAAGCEHCRENVRGASAASPFPSPSWLLKPCEEGNVSFSKGIKTDFTASPWLMPSEGEVALPQMGRDGCCHSLLHTAAEREREKAAAFLCAAAPASSTDNASGCCCLLLPLPLGYWVKPCEEGNSSFSKGIKIDFTASPWLMPREGVVGLPRTGRDGR